MTSEETIDERWTPGPLRERPGFASTAWIMALATFSSLFRRKKLIFLLLLLTLPPLITGVAKYEGAEANEGFLFITPLFFFLFLVPLISLFHSTGLFNEETENQTIAYLLVRPVSRDALFAGKFAGATAATWTLLAGSMTAAWAVANWRGGFSRSYGGPEVSDLAGFLSVLALAIALVSALFSLIGLLVRHSTIVCLLWMVIVEIAFSVAPGPPARLAISSYASSILPDRFITLQEMIAEGPRLSIYEADPPVTVAGMIVALGGLLAANVLVLRRMDFASGDRE